MYRPKFRLRRREMFVRVSLQGMIRLIRVDTTQSSHYKQFPILQKF